MDVSAQEARLSRETYSIEAEDLIVDRLLFDFLGRRRDSPGFFVDLGACDPIRASNTYRLYKQGWRGINVEANPDAIMRFLEVRPRDITLNVAIGPAGEVGQYVAFDEPLLNGFLARHIVDQHVGNGRTVLHTSAVMFQPINRILADHVPDCVLVEYLNIDVELMELSILSQWDFSRWCPKVISVEVHGPSDINALMRMPIAGLLADRGYCFTSRVWHTSFFVHLGQRC